MVRFGWDHCVHDRRAAVQKWLSPWFLPVPVVLCPAIVLGAMISAPRLVCPGCSNELEPTVFGSYCPECGVRQLNPGDWYRGPRCAACKEVLHPGGGRRGRNYTIRVCTHCGLVLDDKGI